MSGVVFDQIDDRPVEAQRSPLDLARPQRFQLDAGIERACGPRNPSEVLHAKRRIFGDFDITYREARALKQAKAHLANLDLPAQRSFQSVADTSAVPVGAE